MSCSGSLKFDGAETDRANPRTQQLRKLADFSSQDTVWVVGSTQAPEEQYALQIFQSLATRYPHLQLVLVPRHPERFEEVARLLDGAGVSWLRRSRLSSKFSSTADQSNFERSRGDRQQPRVLLVDTIGELGAWWGTATLGFVGGSFGSRGGQNMLEPAAYGVATSFGPNTQNFRDVVAQLLGVEGALVVHSREELQQFVTRALEEPPWATAMGQRAQDLVLTQQGAAQRTVAQLLPLADPLPSSHPRAA